MKNLHGSFCHMQCITMLTHMLDYDFACTYDYIHIYGVCTHLYIYIYMYLYIHDRTFVIYERIPYTYINSTCTYDLIVHTIFM